jgi:hypothetical protein
MANMVFAVLAIILAVTGELVHPADSLPTPWEHTDAVTPGGTVTSEYYLPLQLTFHWTYLRFVVGVISGIGGCDINIIRTLSKYGMFVTALLCK